MATANNPFEIINIGTSPNDKTGDTLRVTGGKINRNFELVANGINITLTGTYTIGANNETGNNNIRVYSNGQIVMGTPNVGNTYITNIFKMDSNGQVLLGQSNNGLTITPTGTVKLNGNTATLSLDNSGFTISSWPPLSTSNPLLTIKANTANNSEEAIAQVFSNGRIQIGCADAGISIGCDGNLSNNLVRSGINILSNGAVQIGNTSPTGNSPGLLIPGGSGQDCGLYNPDGSIQIGPQPGLNPIPGIRIPSPKTAGGQIDITTGFTPERIVFTQAVTSKLKVDDRLQFLENVARGMTHVSTTGVVKMNADLQLIAPKLGETYLEFKANTDSGTPKRMAAIGVYDDPEVQGYPGSGHGSVMEMYVGESGSQMWLNSTGNTGIGMYTDSSSSQFGKEYAPGASLDIGKDARAQYFVIRDTGADPSQGGHGIYFADGTYQYTAAGGGTGGGANTYSISAESAATNSADLRLTGQTGVGTTVDNVNFAGGTGITITRTDGNTITIAANSQTFAAAANAVSQNAATGTTSVSQNPNNPTSPALTLPPPGAPNSGTGQPSQLGYPGNNGLTVTPPAGSGGATGQPSKVGINNPNPTQALDVTGNVKANAINLPDGSSLTSGNNFGQFNVTDSDVGYTWIQSGSLQADRSYDAMTVVSGCHINVDIDPTLDAIRICHADTSNQGNIANSPYYFVKSLGFDDMGHVTNATVQLESNGFANVVIDNGNTFNYGWTTQSGSYLLADTPVDQLTVVGGIGIIAGLSSTYDAIRISHEDTSDVMDITAAANGAVFVNALTFDTFGHVTSANCGVESPAFANVIIHNVDTNHTWSNVENDYVQANNWQGQLQLYSGLGIDLSVDRSGDALRISHEDTSHVANATPAIRTFINSLTFDTFGHAQDITTGTVAEYTITTGSVDSNTANIRLIGTDGSAPSINVKSGTGIKVFQESANNINISGLQYNMTASDTSNGANITLTGTGYTSLVDNIKFANGSNMIITRTDAHTITFTATADADSLYTAGNISGTVTLDRNNGTIQKVTATGDFNLSGISNMSAGKSMTIIIKQDATGSRLMTSAASFKFAGGVRTLTTAANAEDILSIFYDGTTYYCVLTRNYS